MKFNRKGGLGFTEAIMAAMIVTLSLTAYMGLIAIDLLDDSKEPEMNVDHRIFRGLTLSDGKITGDIESDLVSEMERHGYKGVYFSCEVPGDLGFEKISITTGEMKDNVINERFLLNLISSDGRTIPAVVELAVCV
ncbi:MAG: hypothetical protein LBJ20_05645 [Candidatus Methanoplasma sp.]|jgi:hypothetical protein|nr:hypothetical protein [Candidatus Methanoplasma sp.]